MTYTLDLYTDYLLSSTGPTTATGLSRLMDGTLSHDRVTRWLSQAAYGPAEVWRQAKTLIRQAEARRPSSPCSSCSSWTIRCWKRRTPTPTS